MSESEPPPLQLADNTVQFMQSHYETIQNEILHLDHLAQNRANNLFVGITAIAGLVIFAMNSDLLDKISNQWLFGIMFTGSLIALVACFLTYSQITNIHSKSIKLRRHCNRISRLIFDQTPEIKDYFHPYMFDDRPLFYNNDATLEPIDGTIYICMVISLLLSLISSYLLIINSDHVLIPMLSIVLLIMGITINVLARFAKGQYDSVDKKWVSKFPSQGN